MKKRNPFDEQETIIIVSPSQVSKTAEVYTCMPSWADKLRKLAASRPDCVRITQDLGDALFADVERSCVKIIPKRIYSEEYRRSCAERLEAERRKTKT